MAKWQYILIFEKGKRNVCLQCCKDPIREPSPARKHSTHLHRKFESFHAANSCRAALEIFHLPIVSIVHPQMPRRQSFLFYRHSVLFSSAFLILRLCNAADPILSHDNFDYFIYSLYSGRSGFRSTQAIHGTTTYRYNTFILANPMIYRSSHTFPYILNPPHPPPNRVESKIDAFWFQKWSTHSHSYDNATKMGSIKNLCYQRINCEPFFKLRSLKCNSAVLYKPLMFRLPW